MKKIDKAKLGRKSRAAGARFEIKVRQDLEKKGWIVSRFSNNVFLFCKFHDREFKLSKEEVHKALKGIQNIPDSAKLVRKLVAAKSTRFRSNTHGFPDFITFRIAPGYMKEFYEVIGVEVKSNGYLDKEEREKCRWLIENNKFSKILIASKGKKRGEIIYKDFVEDKK